MNRAPLIFLDTETTGLTVDDHIWEVAAVRRDPDGTETEFHRYVWHDLALAAKLPDTFRADHDARYTDEAAVTPWDMVHDLHTFIGQTDEYRLRPHIVGAVPSFDTERIARLLRAIGCDQPPWHHHIQDAETLALGYVAALAREYPGSKFADYINAGTPPIDSDELSALIGVGPGQFPRHTAMGDTRWTMAIWDAVTGGAR